MFQSTRHCLEQRGGMPGLILRWLWWGEVTLHDLKAASPFVIKVAVMLQFGFAVHSVVCKWLQATVQATVQYTVHSRCIVCTGGCATWKNVPCHTFLAPICCVTDLGVTIWSYTTHNVLSQVVPWFQWLLQCLPFGMTIMIFFTDTPQKVKVRKAYVNLRWRRWQWQWWWQWCWSGHGQWCVKSGMWIFFRPTKIWATLVGAILLFIVVLLSDTTFIFHIKGRLMSSIPTDFNSRYLWVEATMEICVLIDCLHPCLHPGCTVVSRDNMHPWYAPLICTPGEERPPEDPRSQRDR